MPRQCARRFVALREQCPWMVGMIGATPFAVNEERPLLDQFAEQLPPTVDELHVSAPYYDRNALALAAALERIRPKELHLYLGLGTKVHGPSLAAVVETANCQLQVRRFDPATFVVAHCVFSAMCQTLFYHHPWDAAHIMLPGMKQRTRGEQHGPNSLLRLSNHDFNGELA